MWGGSAELLTSSRRRIELPWRLDSPRLRQLSRFIVFEAAFLVAYSYAMNVTARTGAPFWAPDAVLLCALLLSKPRAWAVWLFATLPVRLLVAVPPNAPVWFLLAAFANDSLKALVAAALLRRFLPVRGIRFERLHDFWFYLAAAVVVAPALSGLAGAASWLALGREFWPVWRNWFFGDALANLVLTPVLLCVALDWRTIIRARPVRYLEALGLFTGLFFAIQFANQRGLSDSVLHELHEYIPMAFLLLAAVRFGPAGASTSLTMMSMLWITANAANSVRDEAGTFLSVQLSLMVIGVPVMSLAVLIEQQRRTEGSLREARGGSATLLTPLP